MSQADELLMALASDGSTEDHIVIGTDRLISVPDSLKRIAVQFDHNIETVTFDCPRYWDGRDLSEMAIYINYMRPDNQPGSFQAENIVIDEADESVIHFDWVIKKHVTMIKGNLSFLVCATKLDTEGNEEQHWNSELNKDMTISEGLEVNSILEELYPDVIKQILLQLAIKISAPDTATVGQTIIVKSVDPDGKPTEWEAADMLTETKVTDMINTALGVIENGTY